MPTPVAHFLAGCSLASLTTKASPIPQKKWVAITTIIAFSILHDIDYLIAILSESAFPRRTITHAFIWFILAGLISGVIFRYVCKAKFSLGFIAGSLAWISHIFFDMASSLTGPKAFLPFSSERYDLPFHFLPVAEPRIGSIPFNLTCIAFEIFIFGSILCFIHIRKKLILLFVSFLFIFSMIGSIRQSNFRRYIWHEAPKAELKWYLNHLDSFSPLAFALFIEPDTKDKAEIVSQTKQKSY